MLTKSHMKRGALAAAVTVVMVMGGVVQAQAQSGGMGGSGGAMDGSTETWGTGASGSDGTAGSGTPVVTRPPATSGAPGGTGNGTGMDSGTGMGMPNGGGHMPNGAGQMPNGTGTYGTDASEATGMQGRDAWGDERKTMRSRALVSPGIPYNYPEGWSSD